MSSCPRCLRPLPPTVNAICVYCGASLTPSQPKTRPLPAKGTDPLVGKTVAGRFHVEDLIGQGGMGKVYKARHLALDRPVVLKMLKPALLEDPTIVGRFEREAKAASRLNHPNVIQVLDFGRQEKDGALYIVMEFVQGKDLRVILRDEWPLAEDRLCNIMAQVCAALSEAHIHNIIHRDLKPENVMVADRREQADFVKVLDFGIAKLLDAEGPGLTSSDVVCGTPQYMAPEQATGTHLDARCDLYAVGVILYQMATGHLPFDGANSMEVLTKQVHDRPIPPRQRQPDAPISDAMEALILRALEKDAGKRPQTAEQFREELLAVPAKAREKRASLQAAEPLLRVQTPAQVAKAAAAPTLPAHPRVSPERERPSRRSFLVVAAAAAAALLAVGGLLLWEHGRVVPANLPAASTVGAEPADRARVLLAEAQEKQASGDDSSARGLLEEAVRLDPDNADAHFQLGGLLLSTDSARARTEYEASRRLDPKRYAANVDSILNGIR